tara:strand:- start:4124 stop:6139 length:2016 start_codon:yes stop_codon:yes gene_type:complete
MARYEADSVQFAERQFEGVRQREDERVQQQKKREKKLLMLQTVAKGANALINQRADEFDRNQVAQKVSYQNFINSGQKQINIADEMDKQGVTAEAYFTKQFYDKLIADTSTKTPEFFQGTDYKEYLYEKANAEAKKYTPIWQNVVDAARQAPTLDEYTTNYNYYADRTRPKDIFTAATQLLSKIGKTETKESLEIKNQRASNVLYGTEMATKLNTLGTNLKALRGAGFDTVAIVQEATEKAKEGGVVIKNLNYSTITKDVPGGTESYILQTGERADGQPHSEILEESRSFNRDDAGFVDQQTRAGYLMSVPDDRKQGLMDLMGEEFLKSDSEKVAAVEKYIFESRVDTLDDRLAVSKEIRELYTLQTQQRSKVITQEMIDNPDLGLTQDDLNAEMWSRDTLDPDLIRFNEDYSHVLKALGWDYESFADKKRKEFNIKDEIPVSEEANEGVQQGDGSIDFTEINQVRLDGTDNLMAFVSPDNKDMVEKLTLDLNSPLNMLVKRTVEDIDSDFHTSKQYNGNYNGGVKVLAKNVNLGAYTKQTIKGKGSILYDPDTKQFYITTSNIAVPTPVASNVKEVSDKFKLDADTINDILSSSTNKGSLIDKVRNTVGGMSFSRQQLINLGYIDPNARRPAALSRAYQNQMAKNKMIADLVNELQKIQESNQVLMASKD